MLCRSIVFCLIICKYTVTGLAICLVACVLLSIYFAGHHISNTFYADANDAGTVLLINSGLGYCRLMQGPRTPGYPPDLPVYTGSRWWSPMRESSQMWTIDRIAVGWPAKCLTAYRDVPFMMLSVGHVKIHWGFTWNHKEAGLIQDKTPPIIPIKPIWTGLAMNSIIYASCWFLLMCTLRRTRRTIRRSKRLCMYCAYPLGKSTVCSECGKEC